jgi:PleD family two-component response regulator
VERFRKTIENHRFPQVGNITVSIGFTSFHPEQSPVEILGQADRALYYAKEHGRNQSCQYEQLLAAGLLQAPQEMEPAPIEFF